MNEQEAFFQTHEGLKREGPGSLATTKALFDLATSAHPTADAIDLGCGRGASSLWLAQQGLRVRAIGKHGPFLDQLRNDAADAHLSTSIITVQGSIDDAAALEGPYDLAWSEGTAYIIGLEKALTLWRRLLRPGGRLVLTDCFWTTDKRSPDAVAFWSADPNMMNLNQASALFSELDLEVVGSFTQPNSDWFDEYYLPMESRLAELEQTGDPLLQSAVGQARQEIDVRRKFGDEYEHVGFVLTTAHS